MEKILINATGAKKGGALTIIESYCKAKAKESDNNKFYYVLSPHKPCILPKMSRWIKISTSGFGTTFFALVTSWFYYKFLGCNKLISFSNINTLLPAKKITYFHQFLTLSENNVKHKAIRFLIRKTQNKNNLFILQTPYVRDVFIEKFGAEFTSKVCWPGVSLPTPEDDKCREEIREVYNIEENKKLIVCPIPNINIPHKNFKALQCMAPELKKNEIVVLITCPVSEKIMLPNVIPVGNLPRDEYIRLVSQSNGVLILSSAETISLPIFEAVSLNKPAFVLSMPYVKGLNEMFGSIDGLFEFSSSEELIMKINSESFGGKKYGSKSFIGGCWDF